MEYIMTYRITEAMIEKKLLNPYKTGFQKWKSTTHQVLKLAEHIHKWFNKRPTGRTVSIFIDAAKAFDSVWHDGLRKMLHDAEISQEYVRWISSFLSNRYGKIRVNDFLSKEFILAAGVPQGSIISPLLYIFFVKDLPTEVTDRMISSFYADDSSYAASDHLHRSSKIFVTDLLQPILQKLETFCAKWRVGLNPNKTWCVNFHLTKDNNNTPHLYLQGNILKYQKSFKFLGITFDQSLSFKAVSYTHLTLPTILLV